MAHEAVGVPAVVKRTESDDAEVDAPPPRCIPRRPRSRMMGASSPPTGRVRGRSVPATTRGCGTQAPVSGGGMPRIECNAVEKPVRDSDEQPSESDSDTDADAGPPRRGWPWPLSGKVVETSAQGPPAPQPSEETADGGKGWFWRRKRRPTPPPQSTDQDAVSTAIIESLTRSSAARARGSVDGPAGTSLGSAQRSLSTGIPELAHSDGSTPDWHGSMAAEPAAMPAGKARKSSFFFFRAGNPRSEGGVGSEYCISKTDIVAGGCSGADAPDPFGAASRAHSPAHAGGAGDRRVVSAAGGEDSRGGRRAAHRRTHSLNALGHWIFGSKNLDAGGAEAGEEGKASARKAPESSDAKPAPAAAHRPSLACFGMTSTVTEDCADVAIEGLPGGAVGLGNLGNTCFMNAAVQCLRATPHLLDILAPQLLADPAGIMPADPSAAAPLGPAPAPSAQPVPALAVPAPGVVGSHEGMRDGDGGGARGDVAGADGARGEDACGDVVRLCEVKQGERRVLEESIGRIAAAEDAPTNPGPPVCPHPSPAAPSPLAASVTAVASGGSTERGEHALVDTTRASPEDTPGHSDAAMVPLQGDYSGEGGLRGGSLTVVMPSHAACEPTGMATGAFENGSRAGGVGRLDPGAGLACAAAAVEACAGPSCDVAPAQAVASRLDQGQPTAPELTVSKEDIARSTLHAMALLATAENGTAAWPRQLFADLRGNKLGCHFCNGAQHDAAELLSTLIAILQETSTDAGARARFQALGGAHEGSEAAAEAPGAKASRLWARHTAHEASPVTDLFSWQAQACTVCGKCGGATYSFDPMTELPLSLSKEGRSLTFLKGRSLDRLEDCLKAAFDDERLEGANLYDCYTCGALRPATRSLRIQRFPRNLILQLKRFRVSGPSHARTKITTAVAFPLHGLHLGQYASESSGAAPHSACYDLFAVINHVGAWSDSGHYTAFCKVRMADGEQRWHLFDDDKVLEIGQDAVNTADAYMLFYTMRQAPQLTPRSPSCATERATPRTESAASSPLAASPVKAPSSARSITGNAA